MLVVWPCIRTARGGEYVPLSGAATLFAAIQKGHSGSGCHLSSNPLVPAHDQESVALLEVVPAGKPGAIAPTVLAGEPDACRALFKSAPCLRNCTVGPRCKFVGAFTSAIEPTRHT